MSYKRRYTLEEILKMDMHLMNLAAYEVSKRMTALPSDVDSVIDYQEQTKKCFKYFKQMIKSNECTIEDVEQMVVLRYGPIASPYGRMSINEALKVIVAESYAHNKDEVNTPTMGFMDALLMGLQVAMPNAKISVDQINDPCEKDTLTNHKSRTKESEVAKGKRVDPKKPQSKCNVNGNNSAKRIPIKNAKQKPNKNSQNKSDTK